MRERKKKSPQFFRLQRKKERFAKYYRLYVCHSVCKSCCWNCLSRRRSVTEKDAILLSYVKCLKSSEMCVSSTNFSCHQNLQFPLYFLSYVASSFIFRASIVSSVCSMNLGTRTLWISSRPLNSLQEICAFSQLFSKSQSSPDPRIVYWHHQSE